MFKFNNLDNTEIFNKFYKIYGNRVVSINTEINVCCSTSGKGEITNNKFTNDLIKDTPYAYNSYYNEIIKSDEVCKSCNLNNDEEMALIAHELGHIYIAHNKIECKNEEFEADDYVKKIGLSSHLKSALRKMLKSNISPEQNDELQKRIERISTISIPFIILFASFIVFLTILIFKFY